MYNQGVRYFVAEFHKSGAQSDLSVVFYGFRVCMTSHFTEDFFLEISREPWKSQENHGNFERTMEITLRTGARKFGSLQISKVLSFFHFFHECPLLT